MGPLIPRTREGIALPDLLRKRLEFLGRSFSKEHLERNRAFEGMDKAAEGGRAWEKVLSIPDECLFRASQLHGFGRRHSAGCLPPFLWTWKANFGALALHGTMLGSPMQLRGVFRCLRASARRLASLSQGRKQHSCESLTRYLSSTFWARGPIGMIRSRL